MTIRYSRGRNKFDNRPVQKSLPDFDAFERAALMDRAPEKGLQFACAPMRVNGDGHPHRGKDFAEPRRWIAFDVDRIDGPDVFRELEVQFVEWRGFGWTTHSSTPDAPRCRVVLELDREVDRAEGQRIGLAIQRDVLRLMGDVVEFDESVYRAEQPVYLPPNVCRTMHFDGDPVAADEVLRDAPALEARPGLQERATDAERADPVVAALEARDGLLKRLEPGKLAVVCPFDAEHSEKTSDTATVYLLPNFGGVRYGKFRCLHAHCTDRGQEEFIEALGLDVRSVWKAQSGGESRMSGLVIPQHTGEVTAIDAVDFSDDALALEFVERFGVGFRWTPGMDWMVDVGDHWARDESLSRFDCARRICREASGRAEKAECKRLSSAKTVAAALAMAQSDRRVVLPASAWDTDAMILNTPDGIVDLRTGAMRERRSDYVTQVARVSPDPRMKCPTWLRFLGEVFLSNEPVIEFVQRMTGYMLTGDRREQKMFFGWGTGANGKSTLIDLHLWIMGSYGVKLPTMTLMQSSVDRHPTELAQLRGKRLAVSNELDDGQYWAESRIKELTGDETLTARFMRQDFFEFPMTQKHFVAGNYKPRLKGGDPAIARRMVLIPFTETFEGKRKDATLPAKLKAEAPAILAWMVEGAAKWARDGLVIPDSIRSASAEYLAENDDLAIWIEERCLRGNDHEDTASDLYASFSDWKRDRGEHASSQTAWGQRMAVLPGISKRRSGGIRYCGVRLLDAEKSRVRIKRQGA